MIASDRRNRHMKKRLDRPIKNTHTFFWHTLVITCIFKLQSCSNLVFLMKVFWLSPLFRSMTSLLRYEAQSFTRTSLKVLSKVKLLRKINCLFFCLWTLHRNGWSAQKTYPSFSSTIQNKSKYKKVKMKEIATSKGILIVSCS